MDRDAEGIEIKFKKDARSALIVLQNTGVVGNAVLVCVEGFRTGGNVGGRDDMQEILVRGKGLGRIRFGCEQTWA